MLRNLSACCQKLNGKVAALPSTLGLLSIGQNAITGEPSPPEAQPCSLERCAACTGLVSGVLHLLTARHSTARRGTARRGTAWRGTARRGTARRSAAHSVHETVS